MLKSIILLLAFVSLVSFSSMIAESAFVEDFNDGKADKWDAVSGDWKVENSEYIQVEVNAKGGGEARNRASGYAIGDKNWVDYTFEVKINPVSSNNYAGIMLRVGALDPGGDGNTFNNKSQYYYWLIGIGGNYSKIWQAPALKALEESPGDTLKPNKWGMKLRLRSKDRMLSYILMESYKKISNFLMNLS